MKYRTVLLICFAVASFCIVSELASKCIRGAAYSVVIGAAKPRLIGGVGAYAITFQYASRHPLLRPDMSNRLKASKFSLLIVLCLIIQSGDVQLNPGPVGRRPKFPCLLCDRACKWGQKAIQCDSCDSWHHAECLHMSSSA